MVYSLYIMNVADYRCSTHREEFKENYVVSPCRAKCKHCKRKRVHGYSNPDHITNSFGYLFLFPVICGECAEATRRCMWCPC